MSTQPSEIMHVIGEIADEHVSEDGFDVIAVHRAVIEGLKEAGADREVFEQLKLTVNNQFIAFNHIIDEAIEEARKKEETTIDESPCDS